MMTEQHRLCARTHGHTRLQCLQAPRGDVLAVLFRRPSRATEASDQSTTVSDEVLQEGADLGVTDISLFSA